MKLTENFYLSEFDCNDGTPVPAEFIPNAQQVANNLQILRDYIKAPVVISGSGYRTPAYNKTLRGAASKSYHMKAMAADISTRDLTPKQLVDIIKKLIAEGKMNQGGIGLYNGFVHYDIRGTVARWDKSTMYNF